MTIITFIPRKDDEQHREIARIGVVDVGYVMDIESASGAAKPHWCSTLPTETARVLYGATSRNHAKQQLILRIADWFDCLEFKDKADAIRSEALCVVDDAA